MKVKFTSLLGAMLLLAGVGVAAEDFVLYQLGPQSDEPVFFPGKVSYARSMVLGFDSAGTVSYVASPGALLRSRTTDAAGKEIHPGDIIASKDTAALKAELEIARIKVRIAETCLSEKKENYERDHRLFDRGSVSAKAHLDSKTGYENALNELISAKAEVVKQENLLERSILRAPYPCVVSEIYKMPHSGVDTAHPVVKIVFPYAMKVTVQLPPGLTPFLDQSVRAMIYPIGSSTPVASWFQRDSVHPTTLDCYVYNPEIEIQMPGENENGLPKVGEFYFVFKRLEAVNRTPALWISPNAIYGSGNDRYVWKVEQIKAFDLTRSIPRELNVVKEPVQPLDRFVDQGMYGVQALADGSKLEPNDIVVGDVPEGFKGGKVRFREKRKQFRDGDVVNVQLIGLPVRGIYRIPRAAVKFNRDTGVFEVMLLKGDRFEPVPVLLAGPVEATVPVFSDNLPAGSRIAAIAARLPSEPRKVDEIQSLTWHPLPLPPER